MCFRNYRLWKCWLDHSLKSDVSENALTVNMWNVLNTREIYIWALLSAFFIIFREVDLENVSPSVRWNLTCVCWYIACWCQVSCWILRESAIPNSNAIIWKTTNFFSILWTLHQTLNILKKKMIAIGNVFPKLQTVKIFVRALSKKGRFRKRFDTKHVKVSQILAKSPSENFYHLSSSFSAKLIWKMSSLVLGEIFGVFVDTFPAEGKYPVEVYENLPLPIEMQLSEKRKKISQFFLRFLEST